MSTYTVLVTGANSGLGYATCTRLITEFLATRTATTSSLSLIITTRSATKSRTTLARLSAHLAATVAAVYAGPAPAIAAQQAARVRLSAEQVDLLSVRAVRDLAERLVARGTAIDVLILNAGVGGWSGIDWAKATRHMLRQPLEALLLPDYKRGMTGREAPRGAGEEGLGETFAANVFGHYLLAAWAGPALRRAEGRGRVVWVGSIEASGAVFDLGDLQGVGGDVSYDVSKRLTELLVLTSEMRCAEAAVGGYLGEDGDGRRPRMYLAHPGVAATSIAGLNAVMTGLMLLAFYAVRLLGSPWHAIQPYKAAVSCVWLALATQETLDELERREGKAKWGAATDRTGHERVVRTEVDGWGWGGKEGEEPDAFWNLRVRWWQKGPVGVNKETREAFEDTGAKAWVEMEALRRKWEKVLEGV